jgi:hypothetical protein
VILEKLLLIKQATTKDVSFLRNFLNKMNGQI